MGPDVLSNAQVHEPVRFWVVSYVSGGVCGALQISRRATQQVGGSLPLACIEYLLYQSTCVRLFPVVWRDGQARTQRVIIS